MGGRCDAYGEGDVAVRRREEVWKRDTKRARGILRRDRGGVALAEGEDGRSAETSKPIYQETRATHL